MACPTEATGTDVKTLPSLLPLVALVCSSCVPLRPLPDVDLEPAARIYNGYAKPGVACWKCHGGTGGGGRGPSLSVRVPRRTRGELVTTITHGQGRMPEFKDELSSDEISMLGDWLKRTYPSRE